jgi:DNA polymerase (family 10)
MGLRRDALDALDRCAFAAELLGEPSAKAWANATWGLRQFEGDLAALVAEDRVSDIPGLGKKAVLVVEEVAAGKVPASLAALAERLPEGLFEIRKIRGLGAKKVMALWKELGITSLGELEYACTENRLLTLKGFGKKTQESVLAQIPPLREERGRRRRDDALGTLSRLTETLRERGALELRPAGGLRRGEELIDEIVGLVVGPASIDRSGLDPSVRLICAGPEHAGWAWIEATGPAEHVEALRARAEARGVSIEASATEEAAYAALGLPFVDPEDRTRSLPVLPRRLVRQADLRGALHNHTVASDGASTLAEMRAAAEAWGLAYLGISEHSESAFYAKGLDAARLRSERAAIAALNSRPGCVLLTGVESDILEDGALDYPDEVLDALAAEGALEVLVASAHKRTGHDRAAATARMVRAASHPRTAIIGHPTGRLLLGRPPVDFDVEALLDACARSGCAIELNANPQRLDLSARWLAMAKERSVLVSIAADAHHARELDHLEHGLSVARRAGLGPGDVLNCMELDELRAWLAKRAPAPP